MKKKVKILLIVILLIAIAMLILYLIGGKSMTGKVTSMFYSKSSGLDSVYVDNFINTIIEKANSEEKYMAFISESKYNSVNAIIGEKAYYFVYDNEFNIVKQSGEVETDFTMNIRAKKFAKAVALYEAGEYSSAALKISSEVPRKVKINLLKQCMNTEWCKNGNF